MANSQNLTLNGSLYIGGDGTPLFNPNGKKVKIKRKTAEAKKAQAKERATKRIEHITQNQLFTPPLVKAILARANIILR